MSDIYSVYVPVDVQALKADVFDQVMRYFVSVCAQKYAPSADDVEVYCDPAVNPHLFDVVRQFPQDFEVATKLTLFESKLMTIVRRDKQIAAALAAAQPTGTPP